MGPRLFDFRGFSSNKYAFGGRREPRLFNSEGISDISLQISSGRKPINSCVEL
jgi:hypothetical protein